MFSLGPPAPCYAILEAVRPGRSPWSAGAAAFPKGSFQVNQTLSAGGQRHKGRFQGTLPSRGRAEANSGGEAMTKSPSHTSLRCVLRVGTRARPEELGGFPRGIKSRPTSLPPTPRRSEGPRPKHHPLCPQGLRAVSPSLSPAAPPTLK